MAADHHPSTPPPRATIPPGLPGFLDTERFWERETERWTVKLLPGECYVTCNDEAIVTVLGSCISACIRDPDTNLGGMNHFMLAEQIKGSGEYPGSGFGQINRYGCFAMESLINNLMRHGAQRDRLEIKVFGGGRILKSMTDIGARNIAFIHSWARTEGVRLVAHDLGGVQPRKLVYFPATGRARVRRLPAIENRSIADRELYYLKHLAQEPDEGHVEIFT
jgi:chemotaxis protein CheD